MTAPPFTLVYTDEAATVLEDLASTKQYADKLKKVRKALRLLAQQGPRHTGLHFHQYQSLPGPGGAPLSESYL